jgi:N-hydroxyarylamine O-acetyltransferase
MSESTVDLDVYCQAIGYHGVRAPTLATLCALQAAHAKAIPFENLDVLAGQVVALDLASLQRKLLGHGRGGFCFEHNTLFWQVLKQLGFKVSALAARVRRRVPAGQTTPLGHMALRVDLDDVRYLVDVGYGGLTLTTPLSLDAAGAQATTHEACRIVQSYDDHLLQAELAGKWEPLYQFELSAYYAVDFEVWNWFTCTAPKSPFVNTLMAARTEPGRRHALLGNRYTVHELAGASTSTLLRSAAELREVLEVRFGIRVPDSPVLSAKLQAIGTASEPL